jgi:hypothetical protein
MLGIDVTRQIWQDALEQTLKIDGRWVNDRQRLVRPFANETK